MAGYVSPSPDFADPAVVTRRAAPDRAVLADLTGRWNTAGERLLIADARRLGAVLQRASSGQPIDAERFGRDLDAALLRAENRQRLKPAVIVYPEELPVSQAREAIGQAITDHQVIVLCGETGSGKTTQLPKLCLELGRGTRGLIGHTQPRRLAARSVAKRIAEELGSPLGQLVGYETRFDRRVCDASLIKLMTDGILLAELQRDHELTAYDTIIIDEAHERSLNIDFLLGWLRTLLPRRPELKLIVTSATLDPERLAKHFAGAHGPAPILKVEGRAYPVQMRYSEPDPELDLEGQVADGIESLWSGGGRPGDVLVFLPGEREIRDLVRSLPGRFPKAEVLPLYSRLPAEQQDRVFGRGSAPRIVLATNVAETSVTVPGIRYVIDTGTARVNRYSTRLGVQQLQIEAVSQAAANQRAGRCGRVGPGVCLRLYPETDFVARDLFTDPEVLRANLAGVILQMAALGLGDVDAFPWVDAPENRHVSEGYRLLQTLGALDDDRKLTPLGRELARLPLDPRIARIVAAAKDSESDAVCVLAAAMSVQDPHENPPDQQTQSRQKHAVWRHPRSDFYTLLNLWRVWQQWSAASSNRALRKLCREHYLSYLRMEEWEAVYKQIVDLLGHKRGASESLPSIEKLEELYAPIHKALAAGLIDHIGLRLPAEKNVRPEFQGPRGRKFKIFPGSTLAKKPPPWVLSAQLSQTSQLFARTNAEIEPLWLSEVGAHLVKKTVTHPVWNPERGEVQCTEYHTLFGMQLLKRNCHYGSIDPIDARRIFITEGLVRGQWTAKPRFLTDNLALVEAVQDKETRLRRPDLLADDSQLYAFYDLRIPSDICTANTLKHWLRHASNDKGDPGRLLRMQEPDVLRPGAQADVADLFPDHIDIGAHRITLSYQHEPGEDEDGVSFHIPLTLLYQLPNEPFDWLVPGLRAARIEALIRSLPMNLRRQCTPAAEYANALSARMQIEEGDFLLSMTRHFQAMIGVKLKPDDFEPAKIAAHLRPTLLLVDAQNKTLARAESLIDLRRGMEAPARAALTASARNEDIAKRWVRSEVRDWDFGDLPEYVDLPDGARAWPALSVSPLPQLGEGHKISLALFESATAASAAHTLGVRTLLLSKLSDRMRDLVKTAKARLGLSLIGSDFDPESIARGVAGRAAAHTWTLAELRSEAAFKDAVQHRGDFGREAVKRLDDVCAWLLAAAELRRGIRALDNRWPESLADLSQQIDTLFAPGFIDALPETQWPRVAVWLKAAAIRLQRLPNKPARDTELTAPLRKLVAQLPGPLHPARWLLEEWRVAQFAQELKAQGSPAPERIVAAIREAA